MAIYNSVTQKLRKERGQNLDPFIFSLMQSVEQNASTDIGEDVIMIKDTRNELSKPEPPGRNLIFGDLFEMKFSSRSFKHSLNIINCPVVRGPSQCLIYVCKWNLYHYQQHLTKLEASILFTFNF